MDSDYFEDQVYRNIYHFQVIMVKLGSAVRFIKLWDLVQREKHTDQDQKKNTPLVFTAFF